jgi:hypothetical protein
MGYHLPVVINPLRQREERVVDTGYRVRGNPENARRWRVWSRHLLYDQIVFFWFLNSLTMVLFIFGSLAVLRANGLIPDQEMLVWDEAAILATSWGEPGRIFFLLVGTACLFSTQLTLVDGVARSCADILHTNFAWARRWTLSTLYARIAAGWIVAGIALTYIYESLPAILFLMGAGFFGGIAMALYTPLTLFINMKYLPPALRPTRLRAGIMILLSIFYGLFAVVAVSQLGAQLLDW